LRVARPGAVIRLLLTFRRLGWHRFHTYDELAEASGLSLTTVKRIVSLLEKNNYLRTSYDIDTHWRKFRMGKNTVRFTDGYVWYVFENGLLDWDVSISPDN